MENYAALFDDAEETQKCGEASTIYTLTSFFPKTPARIAAATPNAKLIYMMRNPVDRCFSMYQEIIKHYQNASKDYEIHRRFEEFIYPDRFPKRAPREKRIADFDAHYVDTPEFLTDGSDYLTQISVYLKHFDKSALKFILFEDYLENKRRYLEEVLTYIGADPTDSACIEEHERKNTSRNHFDKTSELGAIERFKAD